MPEEETPECARVNHTDDVIGALTRLLKNEDEQSDVVFKIGFCRFPANRVVLAACNEYFRTMFSSSFSESTANEIEIKGTTATAFECVLKYLYTGQVLLHQLAIPDNVELLKLAHLYMIPKLQSCITAYLQKIIGNDNVWSTIRLLSSLNAPFLNEITNCCLDFIDVEAATVLNSAEFKNLPIEIVLLVLKRDTLIVSELEVFNAAQAWLDRKPGFFCFSDQNTKNEEKGRVKSLIRLNLLNDIDILTTVERSKLFTMKVLFKTLKSIKLAPLEYPGYRVPVPNKNVATIDAGAEVVEGTAVPGNVSLNCILSGNNMYYGYGRNYVRQTFSVDKGVTIKLARPFAIETLSFCVLNESSYYVQTSPDGSSWSVVAEKRSSSGGMTIRFKRRAVMYIQIVGTSSQNGTSLDVTQFSNAC